MDYSEILELHCEASVKSVFVTAYLYKWTCYRHFTTLPNLQIRMLLKCFILSLVATVTVAEYVCPKGHLLDAATKKCYTYIRSSSSYAEARTECKKIGYGLVSIPNEIYNAHIQQISTVFLGMTYGYFWIGFSRQGPKWVWDDGSSSGYTNWAEGNNKGRKCAVMKVADGTWVTADCSRGYQAMCSGPALEEETTPKPSAALQVNTSAAMQVVSTYYYG
ncbi:hypothetical protein Y032_0407g905 [Ancylostoma ceylanicum]|uniref:C-type lectin domain-containing protein n=2 Tax=Ancylostoma ceylanicum TaxID=53326 RepID=A0A016X4F8_9BILA|nr:hypothetical protein Y032_0407g905 [Ancylostoma ceylanicum]